MCKSYDVIFYSVTIFNGFYNQTCQEDANLGWPNCRIQVGKATSSLCGYARQQGEDSTRPAQGLSARAAPCDPLFCISRAAGSYVGTYAMLYAMLIDWPKRK